MRLKRLLNGYGLTETDFAMLTGEDLASVEAWVAGNPKAPPWVFSWIEIWANLVPDDREEIRTSRLLGADPPLAPGELSWALSEVFKLG